MARPRHTLLAAERARRLRREMTISEAHLWDRLKGGACGARFRRQVAIGIWIADFACLDPKLVIEVDDPSHEYRDEEERTRFFENEGFVIFRCTNKEVARDIGDVLGAITYWIEEIRKGNRPDLE
jgi:very-short-patch-repair endonuclease